MDPRDPSGREPDGRDELELDAVRSGDADPSDTPDLAAIRRVGAVARSLHDDDLALDDPPPDVWESIATRTSDAASSAPASGPPPADPPSAAAEPSPVEVGRRVDGRLVVAVAAVVVLVVAVVGVLAARMDGDTGQVLAATRLEPLVDVPRAAAVVVDVGETDTLDVTFDGPGLPTVPTVDGFYEVWLIDEDIEDMVSLGPLRGDGIYRIPEGVDFHEFPVVDVSIEPDDGNPTHSGSSVLRGTLTA